MTGDTQQSQVQNGEHSSEWSWWFSSEFWAISLFFTDWSSGWSTQGIAVSSKM